MSRVKHTASFKIQEPIIELFPLFSAEGEKLWKKGVRLDFFLIFT